MRREDRGGGRRTKERAEESEKRAVAARGEAVLAQQEAQRNDAPAPSGSLAWEFGDQNKLDFKSGYSSPNLGDPLLGLVNTSYDGIYIRIHGVPAQSRNIATTNGILSGSTLTALCVMNQEMVYGEMSQMKHGQTVSGGTPLLGLLSHNMVAAGAAKNLLQMRSFRQPGAFTMGNGFRGSGRGGTYLTGAYPLKGMSYYRRRPVATTRRRTGGTRTRTATRTRAKTRRRTATRSRRTTGRRRR